MSDRPLRVCFVVGYFHPLESGAERQALEQGIELARRGHTVHVITRAAEDLPRDEELRGIRVHRWVRVSERGPLFAVSFVAGVVRALGALRRHIDVIHTHQALWEAVATGAARGWLGPIPTLVQPASSGPFGEAESLQKTRGRAWLRKLILRNTCFAAISQEIATQWSALGVPPEKLVRSSSGVDVARFHPGAGAWESRLPPRPRVVFTGRFHPQKNLHVLIDAWPAVIHKHPAHLILAGWGDERAELERHIKQLGMTASVHLIGPIDDVADVLRAADLFVLPSVAEGMSNSLLEAMASGLPCLASDIGGNRDLVEPGVTGRLLDPRSPDAWSRAIIELLRNAAQARALGEAGLARVQREFSLPVVVDRYVALYRRLIDECRNNPQS